MRGAAALLAAALLAAGCGGEKPKPPPKAPAGPARGTAGPAPGGPALAVGITEQNPSFVWPKGAHEVPGPFARWRDALAQIHPAYYRLVVDWSSLQPEAGRPPVFDSPNGGCLRDKPPCGAYGGLREILRALGARQREGGWQALVVLAGTPEWAARPAGGCERDGTLPRSRPPREGDGMAAYAHFVEALLAEARRDGADLHYWAPWNEPNHPFFISPQRRRCDKDARSAAVAPYVEMARTLKDALDRAPGKQEVVLGELAALDQRRAKTTSISEFIRDIPSGLACGTGVWTQHGYLGGRNPVDDVERALVGKGCKRPAIWITETGVGAPRRGEKRRTSPASQMRACRGLHRQLEEWYRDERVTAAFQYTLREDDIFPTGLVSTDLSHDYPALGEWQAWGGEKRPQASDPAPPESCGTTS